MGLKLDMCMCVCARVRIRVFSARVNSGVRSQQPRLISALFFSGRRKMVYARRWNGRLRSPPLLLRSNDTVFPAWIMHARTRDEIRHPFAHTDRKHEIVSRVTILLVFNALRSNRRPSFLYLHGNFIVDGSINVKKKKNKKEEGRERKSLIYRDIGSFQSLKWLFYKILL